jgi:hypothetical protein
MIQPAIESKPPVCTIIAGPNDIEHRFPRSLFNLLDLYSERVDFVRCLMNTAGEPALVFEQVGGQRYIIDSILYQQLKRQAQL